jgi:hypothetical protein
MCTYLRFYVNGLIVFQFSYVPRTNVRNIAESLYNFQSFEINILSGDKYENVLPIP